MPIPSRRKLLAASLGAGAAGGLIAASGGALAQAAQPGQNRGAADPGPQDDTLQNMNPSNFTPPKTDHGNLGNLRASFSDMHNRRTEAGWAREVTVRDFPISTKMAGVDMRLDAGGIRELHWHKPNEWAYVLYGSARITAVDQQNRKFAADVKQGDLWYFPSGVPHSIQGLDPDGTEFLLVFDDGAFSEDSTFLITDWLAHVPKDVLAKNFGVPATTFAKLPEKEKYIFQGRMPGSVQDDLNRSSHPVVPEPFNYALLDGPSQTDAGGKVWIADSTNFKASKNIAAALVEVQPGGMRELHWHPNSDEWQYYISGQARMTVFASGGIANTVDFSASDVGYVPRSMGHYIENTGTDVLRFLEMFVADQYQSISLRDWIANTPVNLVADHLQVDEAFLRGLNEDKHPVVPI